MSNSLNPDALCASPVYALSLHADYGCRHSGACCTADWDVPVELPVYRSLLDAFAGGTLRVPPDGSRFAPFIVEPDLPGGAAAMLERTPGGACVFFDGASRLCAVHRDLGEPALPLTCRHFPRLAVRDGRGTSITLSHFCPTAASMLFRTDVPLGIVAGPKAFPPQDYDGLTVSGGDLPPLLHPRMLMDLDGYAAWERHMISRCADGCRSPEAVVATLARDAAMLRAWRPGAVPLADAVRGLSAEYVEAGAHASLAPSLERHREVMTAVPADLLPPADDEGLAGAFERLVRPCWDEHHRAVGNFLAAKAFASWTAYQGRGIATIVRGLEAALALVRVEASRQCRNHDARLNAARLLEAFRAADFILNHLAAGEELAAIWGSAEVGP